MLEGTGISFCLKKILSDVYLSTIGGLISLYFQDVIKFEGEIVEHCKVLELSYHAAFGNFIL